MNKKKKKIILSKLSFKRDNVSLSFILFSASQLKWSSKKGRGWLFRHFLSCQATRVIYTIWGESKEEKKKRPRHVLKLFWPARPEAIPFRYSYNKNMVVCLVLSLIPLVLIINQYYNQIIKINIKRKFIYSHFCFWKTHIKKKCEHMDLDKFPHRHTIFIKKYYRQQKICNS